MPHDRSFTSYLRRSIKCLIRLIDWLIDTLIGRLIDWLIDRSTYWLVVWLIDWLIDMVVFWLNVIELFRLPPLFLCFASVYRYCFSGVGRLISEAATTPLVLPFFHQGATRKPWLDYIAGVVIHSTWQNKCEWVCEWVWMGVNGCVNA